MDTYGFFNYLTTHEYDRRLYSPENFKDRDTKYLLLTGRKAISC